VTRNVELRDVARADDTKPHPIHMASPYGETRGNNPARGRAIASSTRGDQNATSMQASLAPATPPESVSWSWMTTAFASPGRIVNGTVVCASPLPALFVVKSSQTSLVGLAGALGSLR